MEVFYKYRHLNTITSAETFRNGFVRGYQTVEEMNDPTLIGALAVKGEGSDVFYVGVGPYQTGFASQGTSRTAFHVTLPGGTLGTVRYFSKFYLIQLELNNSLDYFTIPAEAGYVEGFTQAISPGAGGQGGGGGGSGAVGACMFCATRCAGGTGGSGGIVFNSSFANGLAQQFVPQYPFPGGSSWFRAEVGFAMINANGTINTAGTELLFLPGYDYRCVPGNGGLGGTPGVGATARPSSDPPNTGNQGGSASTASQLAPTPEATVFQRRPIGSGDSWVNFGAFSSSGYVSNFGTLIDTTARACVTSSGIDPVCGGLGGRTSREPNGSIGTTSGADSGLPSTTDAVGGSGGLGDISVNRNGSGGNGGSGSTVSDAVRSVPGLPGETGHTGQPGYGVVDLKVWI